MHVGMKIFGQITSIQPLALIISLPNQLFGHVPITNISSQLTTLLEHAEDEFDEAASSPEEESESQIPELSDSFRIGQYVRAVVAAVHASGSTDVTGISKSRDEVARASRRVELSLIPERVNAGVQKSDLKPGFVRTVSPPILDALCDIYSLHRHFLQQSKASKTTVMCLISASQMCLAFCHSKMESTGQAWQKIDFSKGNCLMSPSKSCPLMVAHVTSTSTRTSFVHPP